MNRQVTGRHVDRNCYPGIIFFLILFSGLFPWSGNSTAADSNEPDLARNPVGVILYQHANYEGDEIVVRADTDNLNDQKFNDKASSLKLVGGVTSVAVWHNAKYSGKCQTFTADVPSLKGTTIGNDSISSIRINQNCEGTLAAEFPAVVLYAHANYKGKQLKIGRSAENLKDKAFQFNDKISSLQLVGGATSVALWRDAGFVGKCQTFTGEVPSLKGTDIGNDKISSLLVNQTCDDRRSIRVANNDGHAALRVRMYRGGTRNDILFEKRLLAWQTCGISWPTTSVPPEGVDVEIHDITPFGLTKRWSQWCKMNDNHNVSVLLDGVNHKWLPPVY